MSHFPQIFISYNPASRLERTLAIRLHTVGLTHGLNVVLPYRLSKKNVSEETQLRISESGYYLLFATGAISKTIIVELQEAQKTLPLERIIIICTDIDATESFPKPFFIDLWTAETSFETKLMRLNRIVATAAKDVNRLEQQALAGLLLVGAGILELEMNGKNT